MRSTNVSTTYTAELELTVEAVFQPGYPATGPSYASGGEPGEPDGVEDVEITGVAFERVIAKSRRVEDGPNGEHRYHTDRTIQRINLLDGVDAKNPDVQRLLANLAEALGSDLEADLLASEERGRP